MRKSPLKSCAFLVLAGLASGVVCAVVYPLMVGLVFGIAIAAYFVLVEDCRNFIKIAAFVLASTSAFLVAFLLAAFIGVPSSSLIVAFVCAGFVGAFLVLAAAFYLFGPSNPGWWSLLRVLTWAAGGAVLGGAAAAADGGTLAAADKTPWLLYLIWQPGVALLMGLILVTERERTAPYIQEAEAAEESNSKRNWSKLIPGGIVFAVLLGVLGWFLEREIRSSLMEAYRNEAYQRRIAEAPSLVNLPPLGTIAPEQALIVHEIAGLQPSIPNSRTSSMDGSPPLVEYSIRYGVAGPLPPAGPKGVWAMVFEMPNAAWSHYRLEDWGMARPERVSTVTKFGSKVIQNANGAPILGTLCFNWTSDRFLVAICYDTPTVDEDFLKQYLEKYPSSL